VTPWTTPSTPRIEAATPRTTVANPLQVWASAFENLFSLQRKTWANLAGLAGTRNTQDR
jgi:hypothetical protein